MNPPPRTGISPAIALRGRAPGLGGALACLRQPRGGLPHPAVRAGRTARRVAQRLQHPGGLTGREAEVLRLVARSLTTREIADRWPALRTLGPCQVSASPGSASTTAAVISPMGGSASMNSMVR